MFAVEKNKKLNTRDTLVTLHPTFGDSDEVHWPFVVEDVIALSLPTTVSTPSTTTRHGWEMWTSNNVSTAVAVLCLLIGTMWSCLSYNPRNMVIFLPVFQYIRLCTSEVSCCLRHGLPSLSITCLLWWIIWLAPLIFWIWQLQNVASCSSYDFRM